jgi:hypothetical protein
MSEHPQTDRPDRNGEVNKLYPMDRPVHDWYRFVLSFPPHLVRTYAQKFGVKSGKRVLDPFCGTGTTLVESQKLGISSVGIEANPMAYFASQVKVNWSPNPDYLVEHAEKVAKEASEILESEGIEDNPVFLTGQKKQAHWRDLDPSAHRLLLANSISPLPLHKALVLLECLNRSHDEHLDAHERLALAKALVFHVSNLHFGPEVGIGQIRPDVPAIAAWLACVRGIAEDLRTLQHLPFSQATVLKGDSRQVMEMLEPQSVDAVITSPPYPNEKDYTRTTRLESVLLGFIRDMADLRALKRSLVRSNTHGVYKNDDDDRWISGHAEVQRIAEAIEARRIELRKTSGFERQYARVTKLYFGGMARHLSDLRKILRPGALLAYVVGDQASYLRVMIRTGELLADISKSLGYEVVNIDLFRTRLSTATRDQLREEVVVLRWPGSNAKLKI